MVVRPLHLNAFEFAVVSALRAKQLAAGCTPRLASEHNVPTTAQMEVASGCVSRLSSTPVPSVSIADVGRPSGEAAGHIS